METIVKIEWDKPEEKSWLCDSNIKIALESYCKNTKFKVKELNEISGSEAIFGFCGWLTTMDEVTIMSAKHDVGSIVELIKVFCKTNNLLEPRKEWFELLTHPND